ncbi:mpv17-like protein [Anastrepha obliqua]|uniref:mpv17-like protein n=1 Tax=Anastrepha obliqua TaxID=95512 RepID=UPI002409AE14|nr:mpv17-like protein [Anastrepha obliqua]
MVVPATVNFLKSKWRLFISAHPLAKGVIAYSIVWPTSSFMQQTIEGRELKDYDWMRILRFGLFGGCYVAPTLYGWLRVASTMWPQTNLRIGVLKAIVEQMSYAPFASTSFYFGMTMLEGKGIDAAIAEVKDKFPKTVKIAIFIIPVLQTINFGMIPEPNRILFVSFCSLFWITFLAHMQKNGSQQQEKEQPKHKQQLKQFQHHLPVLTQESLVPKVRNALAL